MLCPVQAAAAGVSIGSFANTTNAASWHRKLQQVGALCTCAHYVCQVTLLPPTCLRHNDPNVDSHHNTVQHLGCCLGRHRGLC
jgi:hypothetical protein